MRMNEVLYAQEGFPRSEVDNELDITNLHLRLAIATHRRGNRCSI